MNDKRVYLITGVTGMVGRYLAESLRKEGAVVRALVRQPLQSPWLEKVGSNALKGTLRMLRPLPRPLKGSPM